MEWPAFYSMTMNQVWTHKVKLILVTLIQSTPRLSEERLRGSSYDLQRKKPFIPIQDILYPASI